MYGLIETIILLRWMQKPKEDLLGQGSAIGIILSSAWSGTLLQFSLSRAFMHTSLGTGV